MKLIKNELKELYNLIEEKAKYQKVMVLFDDCVSNVELCEIYNLIKGICIYNQQEISNLDKKEILNGYRAIIYMCSAENFARADFDKREYVNLCFVRDMNILPYCINNGTIIKKDLYLICSKNSVDFNMLSSFCFNKLTNYISGLLQFKQLDYVWQLDKTNLDWLNKLNDISEQFEFLDIDILKHTKIKYNNLSLAHLVIVDAIMLMLSTIKTKAFMLVDTYKLCKDDVVLLNKFYKMACNEKFFTILTLNYNCLYNYCLKTKQEILENFINYEISESDLNFIFSELKTYSKNTENFLSYLYLFDFFKI